MIVEIPLGEWLPDLPDYKNPGVLTANNCYPSPGGYSPFLGAFATGTALAGDIRGARRFERADGTVVNVIGTSTDLNVIIGGTVTASGLSYTLGPDVVWSFEQLNAQVWAFAYGQTPVYLADINSNTTFVAHPGTAPKSGAVGRVADFLVTGNMVDIDTSVQPYRVRWSQFNNPVGDYGTDIALQSGYVDLPHKLGPVVGVFNARSDVILQKYGISRMSYTGGATAFRIDPIEDERGCVSQASAVTVGGLLYFLANDGFCRTDGGSVEVISSQRVFSWFAENAELSELKKVQGAVNWAARCVIWSFIPTGSSVKSRQIIYSWEQNRWSTASLENSWLFDTTEAGITLEDYAVLYPDLDAATISLDSPEFRSKDRILAGVVDSVFANITGEPLAPEWETGDFQPREGYRVCTHCVYPQIEAQDQLTTIAIGSRPRYKGEAVQWSDEAAEGVGGFCPVIKDGRYIRARVRRAAGSIWDKATGIQVEFNVTGRT